MVLTNQQLAQRLRECAQRLAQEGANVYRVRALRRAALVILGLPYEAAQLATPQGQKMLIRIPGIGRGIARTIAEWVRLSQESEAGTAPAAVDPDGVVPVSSTLSSATGYLPVGQQSRHVPGQTGDKGKDTRPMIHHREGSETQPVGRCVVDDDVPGGS
jgi:DNA polymerase/3'-5' exonuclease PolX